MALSSPIGDLQCHKNIALPLSSNGTLLACSRNLFNKCSHFQAHKFDTMHRVKQSCVGESMAHVRTPPESSPRGLTAYFTAIGNSPSNNGSVDVHPSSPHSPSVSTRKRKKVRCNSNSLPDSAGSPPKKNSDFLTPHMGQEVLHNPHKKKCANVTSLCYNSNSKHHAFGCKRKLNSSKNTQNSTRQSSKLTNNYGFYTLTKSDPVHSYADVKQGKTCGTSQCPTRFSSASPKISRTQTCNLTNSIDKRMAHVDDASRRRKPLKDRKNIVSSDSAPSPGDVSAQVCTSSQSKNPCTIAQGLLIIDRAFKYYSNPNAVSRQMLQSAIQTYTGNIPYKPNVIFLSSDEDDDDESVKITECVTPESSLNFNKQRSDIKITSLFNNDGRSKLDQLKHDSSEGLPGCQQNEIPSSSTECGVHRVVQEQFFEDLPVYLIPLPPVRHNECDGKSFSSQLIDDRRSNLKQSSSGHKQNVIPSFTKVYGSNSVMQKQQNNFEIPVYLIPLPSDIHNECDSKARASQFNNDGRRKLDQLGSGNSKFLPGNQQNEISSSFSAGGSSSVVLVVDNEQRAIEDLPVHEIPPLPNIHNEYACKILQKAKTDILSKPYQQCNQEVLSPLLSYNGSPGIEVVDLTEETATLPPCKIICEVTQKHSEKVGSCSMLESSEVIVSDCSHNDKSIVSPRELSKNMNNQMHLEDKLVQCIPLRNQKSVVDVIESVTCDVVRATKNSEKESMVDVQDKSARHACLGLTSYLDPENIDCVEENLPAQEVQKVDTPENSTSHCNKSEIEHSRKGVITLMFDEKSSDVRSTVSSKDNNSSSVLNDTPAIISPKPALEEHNIPEHLPQNSPLESDWPDEMAHLIGPVTSPKPALEEHNTPKYLPQNSPLQSDRPDEMCYCPKPALEEHNTPKCLPQNSPLESDMPDVMYHIPQEMEQNLPNPVVQQECSLLSSVSPLVSESESSIHCTKMPSAKLNLAEDVNSLHSNMLWQSGIPLVICQKLDDAELAHGVVHRKSVVPLPKRANWQSVIVSGECSSAVQREVSIVNEVLNRSSVPHSSDIPMTECENSDSCQSTASFSSVARSKSYLQTFSNSLDRIKQSFSVDSDNNTSTTADVSSPSCSGIDMSVPPNCSAISAMSTSQLISYINKNSPLGSDMPGVMYHISQEMEQNLPYQVVQQECSLLSSVSPLVSESESSIHCTKMPSAKLNLAEDVNSLHLNMLLQSGIPLVICQKLDDAELAHDVVHRKSVVPLPKRANWQSVIESGECSSAVQRDVSIVNSVLNRSSVPHRSDIPMTECENSDSCQSTASFSSVARSKSYLQTFSNSLDRVKQSFSVNSDNNTSTTGDVSSPSCSGIDMSVPPNCSAISTMITSQLISYINKVVDNYNNTPAKQLGLMTPHCFRASIPCQHVNYRQVSENLIKWNRIKTTYELYSIYLACCTNLCSRDRYLDVATLQGIVQFLLNEGDQRLAVEAVNTLSSLVSAWPPCTPTGHSYYMHFLMNPYQYLLSKQGLWEMLCEKLESCVIKNPEESSSRDVSFLSNTSDSSDEEVGVKQAARITNWLELCRTIADEDQRRRKTFMSLPPLEQGHRIAAVMDIVVHILEQDFLAYFMFKKHDLIRGLTSPTKQPLVVKLVWFGQSIRGIGTMTTMCRRIIKLFLASTGKLRHILARLVSLMGEIALHSELQRPPSQPYLGPKCKDFARQIVNMTPPDMDIVNDVGNKLKPSWLSLVIIHLRTCQVLGTEGAVSLDIVVSCMKVLIHRRNHKEDAVKKKASNINWKNREGEVRLHIVCRNKRLNELSKLLSDPDIDVNVKDNAGWTPLHEAIASNSPKCVKLLLKYKPITGGLTVDASAKGLSGLTPLMDAVLRGSADLCDMLLKYAGWYLLEDTNDSGLKPTDLVKDPDVHKVLQSAKKKYPYKTNANRLTISTSMVTQENLAEITRLIPAYVQCFLNTFQLQEIMNLAKTDAPIHSEARGDFNYLDYFYGLKNMKNIKKLVKLAKKNTELDPLVRKAFVINHPLIAL